MKERVEYMDGISRNRSCPCGSGKKYKKCCLEKKKDDNKNRLIDKFSLNNKLGKMCYNGISKKDNYTQNIKIYLLTVGHLWIYKLIEKYGYSEYLDEIVKYAIKEKNSLFEWEIKNNVEKDIESILNKYSIKLKKYMDEKFDIFKYADIIEKSKDKDNPYHILTRCLVIAKNDEISSFCSTIVNDNNAKELIFEHGTMVNAMYLVLNVAGEEDSLEIPEELITIISKNMECDYKRTKMKYYPKIETIIDSLTYFETLFSKGWYLISDEERVIISKFLYSAKIVKEIAITTTGLNGILSTVVTRILFDNYWQSLYLVKNDKINEYMEFAHDRMRLHILKREDQEDTRSIDELIGESQCRLLDPIPINGDYFKKSVRDYAIELNLKDEYDKYYEYSSEFIHASLTAVYSGIMVSCSNPEHNHHLTIHEGGSRLIDSVPHIFDILNKHIKLLSEYLKTDFDIELVVEDMFFNNREECIKHYEL